MEGIKRTFWREYNTSCMYHPNPGCIHLAEDEASAQFVSSLTEEEVHAPALDVDYSTTMYEDPEVEEWVVAIQSPKTTAKQVNALLRVLVDCGLMSQERLGRTQLRGLSGDVVRLPKLSFLVPINVIPSSTLGHFHLYIEHEMDWESYRRLLMALRHANVIGRDFCEMSIKHKRSYLLKPGLSKEVLRRAAG